jgi:hypothetical protein
MSGQSTELFRPTGSFYEKDFSTASSRRFLLSAGDLTESAVPDLRVEYASEGTRSLSFCGQILRSGIQMRWSPILFANDFLR